MRRLQLIVGFMSMFCACCFAQTPDQMVVEKNDGTLVEFSVEEVKRVYIKEGAEPEPEPDYVDLGLPSGLKWATCNLGASKPEDYGDYYGWGCTEPYAKGDDAYWPLYFQKIGGSGTDWDDCGTERDPLQEYVYPNNKSISGTKWDAARKKLGGKWRMPKQDEFDELRNNCTWSWSTLNGVNGYKVVNKNDASKYIFLPAAGYRRGTSLNFAGSYGYYWGATPYSSYAGYAYCLNFYSGDHSVNGSYRCIGYTVRPVKEGAVPEPAPEPVDLGLPSGLKWATCNLGADKQEDYGDYYGWGCTEPYAEGENVSWPLYFQKIGGSGTVWNDCGTEKDPLQEYVYPNNKSIAGTKWDAARKKLGGKWRMPSQDEFDELLNNCTWSLTTFNGVNGYKVVNKNDASKYIFLPAAGSRYGTSLNYAGSLGNYWGATPGSSYADSAFYLYFYSSDHYVDNIYRYRGCAVRPVTE